MTELSVTNMTKIICEYPLSLVPCTYLCVNRVAMPIERKCTNCSTWNAENDFCSKCGTVISPLLIEEERERKREELRENVLPSKIDLFIHRWKNSRFILLRWIYYFLYTIGFIFFAIGGFVAWLAASPNG